MNNARPPDACNQVEGSRLSRPVRTRLSANSTDCDDDRLREECGVFGIFGHADAAAITALGLHALQHRGQEAAGIVTFDGKRFDSERRMGLVGDSFSRREVIENTGIGDAVDLGWKLEAVHQGLGRFRATPHL